MPAMNFKYTMDIVPIDGNRLQVTIPEIGAVLTTEGNTIKDVTAVSIPAVSTYVAKHRRRANRKSVSVQSSPQ